MTVLDTIKVPLGSLLLQRPMKRTWDFEHGCTGRHDPDLRGRIQEARGE